MLKSFFSEGDLPGKKVKNRMAMDELRLFPGINRTALGSYIFIHRIGNNGFISSLADAE